MSKSLLLSLLLFVLAFPAFTGCGSGGSPTVIAPDDSVTSSADMEAFYNQAPEELEGSK